LAAHPRSNPSPNTQKHPILSQPHDNNNDHHHHHHHHNHNHHNYHHNNNYNNNPILIPPPTTTPTAQNNNTSLDVPKAPELLGRVIGGAAAKGALPLTDLPSLLAKCEGAEPKRKLAAAAFKAVKAEGGDLAALAAGVAAGSFLGADEFDGDLPSVEEWLKAEGLAGAVPV